MRFCNDLVILPARRLFHYLYAILIVCSFIFITQNTFGSVFDKGIITTIAGTGIVGFSGDGEKATAARFSLPYGVFADLEGNIYIADSENHRVRIIDALTETIFTIAGMGEWGLSGDGALATQAKLYHPVDIMVDLKGNVFIADTYNHCIRKIDRETGIIATVAGTGKSGLSGDKAKATEANLYYPEGIFVDSEGNIFIADTSNNRIRKVDGITGIITTVAGTGSTGPGRGGFSGDGSRATNAMLNAPTDIFADLAGNLFIADADNHRIRKVDGETGIISTVAGNGIPGFSGDGGKADQSSLNSPVSVFIDSEGNVFISDKYNYRIRKIDAATAIITTVVGTGEIGFSGDGGQATEAQLNKPGSIFIDSEGDMLISDTVNQRIRKVYGIAAPTVLEIGDFSPERDRTPPSIVLSYPRNEEVGIDPGLINRNGIIIRFSETINASKVQAILKSEDEILAWGLYWAEDNTRLSLRPRAGHELMYGNHYTLTIYHVADIFGNESEDFVVTFTTKTSAPGIGIITTVAGTGEKGFSGDGGEAVKARFNSPSGTFADQKGNVFIADTDNNRIRKVDSDGIITTIVGTGEKGFFGDGGESIKAKLNYPVGLFIDWNDNIFIADTWNQRVRMVDGKTGIISTVAGGGSSNSDGIKATEASLSGPTGIFIDSQGNMFVADTWNHRIRKIDGVTGLISTIAGTGKLGFSGDDGQATEAELNTPSGVFITLKGDILISDSGNHRIRRIDGITGVITTIAGTGVEGYSGDGGNAIEAKLFGPTGIFMDSKGHIYISDTWNHRIRHINDKTGIINTIAGGWNLTGEDGGNAAEAWLYGPTGIFINSKGDLFIADSSNQRIRLVKGIASPTTLEIGDFSTQEDFMPPYLAESSPKDEDLEVDPESVNRDGIIVVFNETINISMVQVSLESDNNTLLWNAYWSESNKKLTLKPESGQELLYGKQYNLNLYHITDRSGNELAEVAISFTTKTFEPSIEPGTIITIAGTGRKDFSGDGAQATEADLNYPFGISVDLEGNIYIADAINHRVRRVDSKTGIITTVAGTGERGYSGDGGQATKANLSSPTGVFVDSRNNLFITDRNNHCIRKVDGITGIITNVAGNGNGGYSGDDGKATEANLNYPQCAFIDKNGHLYIADTSNHRIRKVDGVTGIITTVAGNGNGGYSGEGVKATEAMFQFPNSVFVDSSGNIFIADTNNHYIRKVDGVTGIVTNIAGNGSRGYSGDGGKAIESTLDYPLDMFVDSSGSIFVADTYNNCIRRITDGIIKTVAGTGEPGFSGDGGKADKSQLNAPSKLLVDSKGNIFIADARNNCIRKVYGVASPTILEIGYFLPGRELIPPSLILSSPENGEIGVDPEILNNDGIVARFSETIDITKFQASLESEGQVLLWEAIWLENYTKLTLKPKVGHELAYGKNYTLKLSHLTDQVGNETPEIVISFTTLAKPENVALFIPEISAKPGDFIAVPVNINNALGVSGLDMILNYDSSILTIHEITDTDLTSNMILAHNANIPGQISLSMAGTQGLQEKDGILIEITFEISFSVPKDTETLISFKKASVFNARGNKITSTTQDGVVKIDVASDLNCVKGDINNDGDIDSGDAVLCLQIIVGLVKPTSQQRCAADMNNDGAIGANDVILILRKSAGLSAPVLRPILSASRTISVKIGEAHGVANERIIVPLTMDDPAGLAAGSMRILYNSSVLRAIDVLSDSNMLLAKNISKPGIITLAFASPESFGKKTLARIEFDVLTDDISPIGFESVELYGFDQLPINSRNITGVFSSWAIAPEENALYQNFPNPFNPETWIPYQLRDDGEVRISIFNVSGSLVRELSLGLKASGIYISRDRAAYWDGKNESGEEVASGTYFYSIKAGEFIAVRKMIVSR